MVKYCATIRTLTGITMKNERKQNQGKPSRDRKQARENKRYQGKL